MTAPLVPRKRASKPKVRTGCETCKKVGPYRDALRRVKCDERKPKCVRCEKLNHNCAYAASSEVKSPKEPSPDSCRSSPVRETGALFYQPRCYNLNSREGLYFELYRNNVAKKLAYPELWYRSVLRESVRDKTIRHGVIAIGALAQAGLEHAARTSTRQAPRRTLSLELIRSAHYREAIQNYTQALSTFRNRVELESGSTPPRTVIIATLLFLLFEQMQGNSDAVQQLTGNVIAMLRGSLITFQANGTDESLIAAEIDDEGVQEAEMVLPRMLTTSLSSCEVHPTLYQVAQQIHVDPCDTEVPQEGASRLHIKRLWDRMITRLTLYTIRGRAALSNQASNLDGYREGQRIFLDRLEKWKELMMAMQEQTLGIQFQLTVKVLLCAIHIAEVYVSCFLDETDQSWDHFTGHYEKIIEITESIFDVLPPSFDGWPMYDCSLPPIIHCVLQKCRDRALHRRAVVVYQKLSQNERSLGLGLITRDASDDVVNDWASEVTTEDGESAVSSPGKRGLFMVDAFTNIIVVANVTGDDPAVANKGRPA
ncbi:Aspercryptin biosynthesis cluster-specific transcription regulator atnN [Apiospora rasikravindrae]|uniref:Aspercryptin biosynthesis cluster-specific transcription regulator atnN n=1 Tax=Apiospora rasikravindrae TaxID=990691 RepID=A0ABR1SN40_9PEZI